MYTPDGKTVYSLVHDEYHGYEHPGQCNSNETEKWSKCWYNALTFATSSDGGHSFSHTPSPSQLVASVPYRYVPDSGAAGMMGDGSQIVHNPKDGYYYATFQQATGTLVPDLASQWNGTCIMRTKTLNDPASWRAWGGTGYTVKFNNPYLSAAAPDAHLCTPIFQWPYGLMGESLTWNNPRQTFVLVGSVTEDNGESAGIYFATSTDLIHWTMPDRIMKAELSFTYKCGDHDPIAYASVIDPTSSDRNFATTGQHAYIYYTRINTTNCQQGPDRDLVRVPITITK